MLKSEECLSVKLQKAQYEIIYLIIFSIFQFCLHRISACYINVYCLKTRFLHCILIIFLLFLWIQKHNT